MLTESTGSKFWWFAGLAVRLLLVSGLGLAGAIVLAVVLPFFLPEKMSAGALWCLMAIGMIAGYTWAIYFHFPFFQSRTSRQHLFISAGVAVPTVFLTYYCLTLLALAALDFASTSDRRTESVTLPSGEILENHTYLEKGWGDERYNTIFLKNPVTGVSERINDRFGYLNYEAGPGAPALLQRYPHPQEFVHGDEKMLIIGPYVCKRLIWKTGPDWDITGFDFADQEAKVYLQSFLPTNDIPSYQRLPGDGLEDEVRFAFDSLDLTNNVLTIKKQTSKWQKWDEFPPYLVYSSVGYHGGSGYKFPWKFDVARTKAKNGPLWDNPMPSKMTLDFSVVTFHKPGERFFDPKDKRNLALARAGAKEVATTTLELSDQELRHAECKYAVLTNVIVDKIEAMYGFACLQTNRFYIIWQPHDLAAWPVSALNLNEWTLVDAQDFESNICREEFIRLRQTGPALPLQNEGLDNTGITIHSAGFDVRKNFSDMTANVIELLHTNPDGFMVNAKTPGSDPFPDRKKQLVIKYEFKGFNFEATVSNGGNVSYKTLINNARK